MSTNHHISIVVPMYNEEECVMPLAERVTAVMSAESWSWELVLVDDGSTDNTATLMKGVRERFGRHMRIVTLARNFGQTAAMQAGIDHARGNIIVTLDGDLQNDPQDIPSMVRRLLDEELDLVAGWRKSRQDNVLLRKIPSRIANRLIRKVTGVDLHDYGCSLKVFRSEVLKTIRLYGEMHRFIPAWLAMSTSPTRIREQVVTHHPRRHGVSKYGLSRTFRVIIDLLSVYFFMRFNARPGHFFGTIGLVFGALGTTLLGYLTALKFFFDAEIGSRPLLFIAVMFVLMSVQFITTGILSELMARTYFESGRSASYSMRSGDLAEASDGEWGMHG